MDIKEIPNELFRPAVVPAGFLLIDNSVLKEIEKPWFDAPTNSKSEDVYFCLKAAAVGQEIWCDGTIRAPQDIGHIGEFIY